MTDQLPRTAIDKLLAVGAEPDTLVVPAELGKYRLVREIGRGGMGRVYEAFDSLLKRRVALKVMPETAGLSETLRRRFAREAQAAAKLSHPNIAAVFDATPDYIAMQLVEGGSILDVPRREPRHVVGLIRDAALAVQYAHDQGIVHRDLKPSNLMVEGLSNGEVSAAGLRVVVLDFGLAKESAIESSLSMSGSILGTPAFMPPEQAEGKARLVDARSDVYSLGATLYACLTGHPPFEDTEVLKVLRQVVDDDPRPPRIEPDLDAIVLKCLAKESERRYPTARELADDLTRWLSGQPVRARPPSLGYKLKKFVARRRALLWAGGLVAATSALIAVPLYLQQEARRQGAMQAVALTIKSSTVLSNSQLLLRRGDGENAHALLDDAAREWRQFLTEHPRVADAHYMLGRLLRVRGLRDDARAALEAALALAPSHVGAHFERGLLSLAEHGSKHARAGTEPAALAEVQALRDAALADLNAVTDESGLRLADVRYAAAEKDRLQGNLDSAAQGLRAVLEFEPEHGEARLALARVLAAQGRNAEAVKLAGGGDLLQGFAPVFLARSELPPETPMPPDGAAVERGAGAWPPPLAVHQAVPIPGLREVVILTTQQRLTPSVSAEVGDRAVERFREAMRAGQTLAVLDLALQDCEVAVDADPENAAALSNRAVIRLERARRLHGADLTLDAVSSHRAALADLDQALRLAPRLPGAHFNRASAWLIQAERDATLGRFAAAVKVLQRALADCDIALQQGDDPGVRALRGETLAQWADALIDPGDHEQVQQLRLKASEDLRLVLANTPPDWPQRAAVEQRLAQLGSGQ